MMDQILQHITQRVDSFKADQNFQLELLKADLVAYVESRCASLVASSSSSSISNAVDPTGSIPPPTPLVVSNSTNSVPRSIDSSVQLPTPLVQQLSVANTTTPSQNSTLFVNAQHSDAQTVPNCTVVQSTNAPSSSSEVVVASTSTPPEQSQQQQQQQSIREGRVKMEIKEEDCDDENVCQCDDLAHNLAPNGPPSTTMVQSNGASTCASSQRPSKSGSRKRALSVKSSNKNHHHRSNKTSALTSQDDDEENDNDESDDESDDNDDNDSDYEVEEEGDEDEEEEESDEVDDQDHVHEDEDGEEDGEEEEDIARPVGQVITVSLRCPESNCPETQLAPGRQFTAHMRTAHSILPFFCAVRGCAQSFVNSPALGRHRANSHQSITEWHCALCPNHFSTYKLLSHHKQYQHQLGHFECSLPGCNFRGQNKRNVYVHYVKQHKRTFKCGQSGCQYETPDASSLKLHERAHRGIKPYRCTWPECDFAATRKSDTISHIRRHLKGRNQSSGFGGAQLGDPKDFLLVMDDLLE